MRKFTSVITALALSATMFFTTGVTAKASNFSDGEYTADIMMWQYYQPESASMCASLFSQTANIQISGDWAKVELFVSSPIPGFVELSEAALLDGGIMKDTVAIVNETRYVADYSIEGVSKYFDKTSAAMFGLVAGNEYTTDRISFTIPTSAIVEGDGATSKGDDGVTANNFVGTGNTDKMIHLESYVNVVMTSTQQFWLELTNITGQGGSNEEETPETPETPSQNETKTAQVTATVLPNESTYSVVIPENIPFGDLSFSSDSTTNFDVEVEMNIGKDSLTVQVETPTTGSLSCDSSTLAFANNFGTKTFTSSATETGTLTIKAEDAQVATAGDYQGTLTFNIGLVE